MGSAIGQYGFVIQLGSKTYPGPLNRRRINPFDPDTEIGPVSISRDIALAVGQETTFTASTGSNLGDLVYTWSGDVSGSGLTTTLTPGAAGTYSITVTVTSATAADSPQTETLTLVLVVPEVVYEAGIYESGIYI